MEPGPPSPTRGAASTYAQLHAFSCRFASALDAAGIGRERRLAMLMLDTVDFPVAFWGAIRAGVVPVPINTLLPAEQIAYILADSRAEALVDLRPFAARPGSCAGRAAAPSPHPDRSTRGRRCVRRLPGNWCGIARAGPRLAGRGGLLAVFLRLHRRAQGRQARPCQPARHRRHLRPRRCSASSPDDLVYSAAKLFFAYGLGNAMTFPMSVGAGSVLLPDRPTPDAVLGIMRRHQPTIFGGVPTLYAGAARRQVARPRRRLRRLRRCISAGEALPESVGHALAPDRRRRHPGRHRLDRDAAHLPVQPAGPTALRHLGRAGAGLRGAHRRRGGQPRPGRRERRAAGARAECGGRLLEPAAEKPRRPSWANGRTPAIPMCATPTVSSVSAAAPTT